MTHPILCRGTQLHAALNSSSIHNKIFYSPPNSPGGCQHTQFRQHKRCPLRPAMDTPSYARKDTDDLANGRQNVWACAAVHTAHTPNSSAIGTGRKGLGKRRVCKYTTALKESREPHGCGAGGGRQIMGATQRGPQRTKKKLLQGKFRQSQLSSSCHEMLKQQHTLWRPCERQLASAAGRSPTIASMVRAPT